eukprot:947759-Ditylum_brightwellii.AAC.1
MSESVGEEDASLRLVPSLMGKKEVPPKIKTCFWGKALKEVWLRSHAFLDCLVKQGQVFPPFCLGYAWKKYLWMAVIKEGRSELQPGEMHWAVYFGAGGAVALEDDVAVFLGVGVSYGVSSVEGGGG